MDSSVQSKRLRAESNNNVTFKGEDTGDESERPVPVLASKKRRLRVVLDSDDDLEEQEGEGTLQAPEGAIARVPEQALQRASAGVKVQASEEASGLHVRPPPSEPTEADVEIDAMLAIDLAMEDEVGDEDIIQGPDDVDEDISGEAPALPRSVVSQTTIDANDALANVLRKAIGHLAKWAKEHNIKGVHKADRPVTFGYWSLLGRVSVDYLVALYLPAISPEVRVLLEKEAPWCLEDFLSLPFVWSDDERQGIYGNFATGAIAYQSDIACDAYIGSSCSLKRRIEEHSKNIARFSTIGLPVKEKNSFHYQQLCRVGVRANFRKLAVFDSPVPEGYLMLLESIFMIIFGTYNDPGWTSFWATKASYDLTAEVRESLKLPVIQWRGMNAAWPLRQGFRNRSAKTPSPCCNPACDRMTHPKPLIPEGENIYCRQLGDSENPLGPYLCRICSSYRQRHGVIPDAKFLQKNAQRWRLRELVGKDPACDTCGRKESQMAISTQRGTGKRVKTPRRLLVHDLYPEKMFCHACHKFIRDNKRARTAEEAQVFLATTNTSAARAAGDPIVCSNCQAVEGTPGCSGRHSVSSKARTLLCSSCQKIMGKTGELRDPQLQRICEVKARLKAERDAGRPVNCIHCGMEEGSSMTRFKATPDGPVCHEEDCRRLVQ